MKTGYFENVNAIALVNPDTHRIHHTSYARGYHTVKGDTVEEYNGRFGKGYKIHTNAGKHTTNYHCVTYVVER